MPIEIRLPELAASMVEGTVAVWRKREGDWVKPGDVLADIETDKSTVELEAAEEGRLGRILVAEGTENVEVGTVLALLYPEGEEPEASAPVAPAAEPEAAPSPASSGAAPSQAPAVAQGDEEAREPAHPAPAAPPPTAPRSDVRSTAGEARPTPLARRMAAQAGLDLSALEGTGAGGRITKADVEAALGGPPEPPPSPSRAPSAVSPSQGTAGDTPFHTVRASRMRRVIAQRLTEAKQTIPHFYLQLDCDVEKLVGLRRELNERLEREGGGHRLTVNDFVVRAAALALQRVPEANVAWGEDGIRIFERVDVGVAVATSAGLVTPVVRDAASLSLLELSRRSRRLAERARAGELGPEEYQGGTFTVSNLGMYGIDTLYAIINPPQSGILGAGAAEPGVVAREGRPVVRSIMSCTLCCDHRAIDGAVGARFLAAVRDALEEPVWTLL